MNIQESDEIVFGPFKAIRRQHAILRKYSVGVQERIKSADSEAEALNLVDSISRSFSESCESHLLRAALERYLVDLVRRAWEEDVVDATVARDGRPMQDETQ